MLILHKLIKIPKLIILSNKVYKRYTSSDINQLTFASSAYQKYINKLKSEYEELRQREVTMQESVRMKYLQPVVVLLDKYNEIQENVKSLRELEGDVDMKDVVAEEHKLYLIQLKELEENIKNCLLHDVNSENRGILFEITAGVGGQEAMLFARNLYDMYLNYIEFKRWDFNLLELDNSDIGGIRHASMLIDGDDVYSTLQVEAGVHRVQRVPTTERSGRIHTSTVTVAVLPQPSPIDITIKPTDIRIETKRASGAGGQHVNTTDSAVRIVHISTGLIVECQTERSQYKNKEIALQRLRTQLYQKQIDEQFASTQSTRKSQVGLSLRNEKIRTYNFNQHRVSDHRIQENIYNLNGFLEGNELLDALIKKLKNHQQMNILLENIRNCE